MPAVRPANPRAHPRAAEILRYFHGLAGRGQLLSGQFTNFGRRADLRLPRQIHRATGRWPALVGVDFADFNIRSGRRHTVQWLMNAVSAARFDLVSQARHSFRAPNRVVRDYWRTGGLVTIGVHCSNPANRHGGGLRDQGVELKPLLQPGTATNRRWLAQLDELAAALQELQAAGVVVLWRPLHEMNGPWFWWGKKKPADFIRVWRHMFRYFTEKKRLDNLLWIFGPNMGENAADYYPGDAFVDLVGLDAYTDHVDPRHLGGYRRMAALGKPFGLTEYGPHGSYNPPGTYDYERMRRGLARHFPKACFFMSWNARWSPANNRNLRKLYLHPSVITRADLPPGLTGQPTP